MYSKFSFTVGESADKLMADDILRTLMNEKKMTKMEAGVVFKIGSGRWNRIKKNVPTDGSVERRLPYGRNGSQMEEREMQVLSNFIDSLEITVAYPCNHRKMKRYLPDVDSWKGLWDSYKVFAEQEPRMMQYSTFHKYVRSRHSEYALGKSREDDDCETCTRLKITAQDTRLTVDERELAKTGLKEQSLEERGMTSLLKEEIKLYGKDLLQDKDVAVLNGFNLGVDFLSDYFDVIPLDQPNLAVDKTEEVIIMQCEGFSNSFSMPFYGNRKQGMDDHHNLVSLHSYIISDMLTGFNRMYTYDERSMGRNLDSICSIRFLHHMRLYLEKRSAPGNCIQPEILYVIMDDSVGPEKSQEGLMFFALLSLLFYKKVICHYLPKSHSHMCADKVISCIRKRIGATINEFHPTGLIQKINEVSEKTFNIFFPRIFTFLFIYFF